MGSRPPGFKSRSPRHIAILLAILLILPYASASESGPIYIVGNGDLDEEHGVSGGSGTPWDPYRIENLRIRAELGDAVTIIGTSAHLLLRNLTITAEAGTGIRLVDVSFVTMENITITGRSGLLIQDSAYVTLRNATVSVDAISILILGSSSVKAEHLELGGELSRVSLSEHISLSGVSTPKLMVDYSNSVSLSNLTLPEVLLYHAGNTSLRGVSVESLSATSSEINAFGSYLISASLLDVRAGLRKSNFLHLEAEGVDLEVRDSSISGELLASWSSVDVEDSRLEGSQLMLDESGLRAANSSFLGSHVYADRSPRVELLGLSVGSADLVTQSCRMLRAIGLTIRKSNITMARDTNVILENVSAEGLSMSVLESFNVSLLTLSVSGVIRAENSTWFYVEDLTLEGKLEATGSYFWVINSTVSSPDAAMVAKVSHFNLTSSFLESKYSYALILGGVDALLEENAFVAPRGIVIGATGSVRGNLISQGLVVNSQGLEVLENLIEAKRVLYLSGRVSFRGNTVIGPPEYLEFGGDITLRGNHWSWAPPVDDDGDGILDSPFSVSGFTDDAPLADPAPLGGRGNPLRVGRKGLEFEIVGNYTLFWIRPWGVVSSGGRGLPGPMLVEGWSPDGSHTERLLFLYPELSGIWSLLWAAPLALPLLRRLRSWARGGTSRSRPRGRR